MVHFVHGSMYAKAAHRPRKTCTHSLYIQYGINIPVGFRIDVLLPNLQL